MRREAACLCLAFALLAAPARAIVLSEDELEERSTEAGAVVRSFAFLLSGDVLAPPYALRDADPSAVGIFDVRGYFAHKTPRWSFVVHEELSVQVRSHAASPGLTLGKGLEPPRWLPLRFAHEEPTLALRSDVDWLYGRWQLGPATVTLGRQPITFGRGLVWRTADRIATFALTEVDTTYKPGADALRIDLSFPKTNVSLVASPGELEAEDKDAEVSLRGSSFVGRAKRDLSWGELGVIGGFVRYDALFGLDAAVDLGSLDVHAELTATRLTEQSLSTPVVEDRAVPLLSAMVGVTWRTNGVLTLSPELLYNGFGSFDPKDYLRVALSERVGIGEQTALGKLYLALTSDWQAHPLTHVVNAMIVNLHDPSALWSLSLRHDLSDNVHLAIGGYAPIGPLPDVKRFSARSEYGSYPLFFFSELGGTL